MTKLEVPLKTLKVSKLQLKVFKKLRIGQHYKIKTPI
jgi:hypothetical protein